MEERLCLRCFSPHHVASTSKENVKCSICGSRRLTDLLHLSTEEKKKRGKDAETAIETQENVNAQCTSICKGAPGGLCCSKIVLVDVYGEDRPNEFHRVYAIVDDQSNASIISTKLVDKLKAEGPECKYYKLRRRQGSPIWEEINRAYHKFHTRENFKTLHRHRV